MPSVTIRVANDLLPPSRVSGVLVELYNLSGVFQTSGTTDVNGEVVVTLPEASYDVLLYKVGVTILPSQPQRIEVLAPPGVNVFTVSCHVRTLPESLDPDKCRITGKVVGADGRAVKDRLIFVPEKYLLVISDDVLLPESRAEFAPDSQGNFDFELFRGQVYKCYFLHLETLFGSSENYVRAVVCDSGGMTLDKLLFPLPINLAFSENVLSIPLADGVNQDITYTLDYSDGSSDRPEGVLWASVTLVNPDNLVVEATMLGGILYITPLSLGTVTLTTIRILKQDVFWKSPPAYVSESIEVTVM